jgi:hypothetical protein
MRDLISTSREARPQPEAASAASACYEATSEAYSTRGHPLPLLTSPFKAKKSGRVVVKDVSLLRCGQVIGLLDRFDSLVNLLGPSHLVGAKHQAVPEAGANEGLDVPMKRRARDDPSDGRQITGARC